MHSPHHRKSQRTINVIARSLRFTRQEYSICNFNRWMREWSITFERCQEKTMEINLLRWILLFELDICKFTMSLPRVYSLLLILFSNFFLLFLSLFFFTLSNFLYQIFFTLQIPEAKDNRRLITSFQCRIFCLKI